MNVSAHSNVISEFTVNATVDELNVALAERGVGASQIVSVIFVPEAALAIGDANAKFRVLYTTQSR